MVFDCGPRVRLRPCLHYTISKHLPHSLKNKNKNTVILPLEETFNSKMHDMVSDRSEQSERREHKHACRKQTLSLIIPIDPLPAPSGPLAEFIFDIRGKPTTPPFGRVTHEEAGRVWSVPLGCQGYTEDLKRSRWRVSLCFVRVFARSRLLLSVCPLVSDRIATVPSGLH